MRQLGGSLLLRFDGQAVYPYETPDPRKQYKETRIHPSGPDVERQVKCCKYVNYVAKLEVGTVPEAYLRRSCSRASMVTAPARDRESDDVRLRRE